MEILKKEALDCAKNIAEWLCAVQCKVVDSRAEAGDYLWLVTSDGKGNCRANNWNIAFGLMGLLAAAKEFNEPRYEEAALNMGRYLKSLQIFDPFKPEHYGAIREMTPQTPWCYTRDALSGAWGFIELYRHTGEAEYLERARLWGEWFLENGMDAQGWPLWGVQFEPYFNGCEPQMCNDMQGSFQGGSLNFFYQLYLDTGDKKWVGDFFVNIADMFISRIQQQDGFFRTVQAEDGKVPEDDPQNGLHRANDDLGCLGLLCAYEVTGNQKYLKAIDKFLCAVFAKQDCEGHFETSCAAIPVVLNILAEAGGKISFTAKDDACRKALRALFRRQMLDSGNPLINGGLDELGNGTVCARSSCYALIYLLKFFGQRQVA